MYITMRAKNQITLPKKIVKDLYLDEDQLFEVFINENGILLVPKAVYPPEVVERWEKQSDEIDKFGLKGYKTADEWLEDLRKMDMEIEEELASDNEPIIITERK